MHHKGWTSPIFHYEMPYLQDRKSKPDDEFLLFTDEPDFNGSQVK